MPGAVAITRAVSAGLAACELTYQERVPIDVERGAGASTAPTSRRYRPPAIASSSSRPTRRCPTRCSSRTWRWCSTRSPSSPIPAPSRAGARCRRLPRRCARIARCATMQPPATIDGGDVLVAGRHVFVGRSTRTNDAADRADAPHPRAVRLHGGSDGGARVPAPEVGGDGARRRAAAGESGVDRRRGVRRVHARRGRARTNRRPPTCCGSRIGSIAAAAFPRTARSHRRARRARRARRRERAGEGRRRGDLLQPHRSLESRIDEIDLAGRGRGAS